MAVVLSVLLALVGDGATVPTHPPARVGGKIVYFNSPSRNIACALHDGSARCDIRQKDWRPPPQPAWCNLDWGYGLTVDRRGRGRFICAGDSVFGVDRHVLPYSRSVRQGSVRCTMRMSGVRCINTRSGHGFFLSKEKARLF
ncbi:MAG TPA: DUF6636 domain-containing protein [Solirubrobacterales bacterium]|nr:DUF6636 domain-containing protein [Solirubrobacterales bacterium]